jgi:hypothetical protein
MRWLKTVGKVIAFPVTGPVKLVRKGVEKTSMKIIATVVRQLLTIAGGTGFVVSDQMVGEVASAAAVIISVVWGIVNARREAGNRTRVDEFPAQKGR